MKKLLFVVIGCFLWRQGDGYVAKAMFTYPSQADQPTEVISVHLLHANPKSVHAAVTPLFPDARFSVEERSRSLAISADAATCKKVLKIVAELDRPLRQIKVEVQIMEINYYNLEEYKQLFSTLTSGFRINYDFQTGQVRPAANFEGVLDHLSRTIIKSQKRNRDEKQLMWRRAFLLT